MEIAHERSEKALVLKPEGRIDGQNAMDFQTGIDATIGDSDTAVILDLSQLDYISSAGLRVILLLAKTLRTRNIQFSMCSIADSVKEVFEISGFGKIIATHPTREDALANLN